jgi:hypothetical protein
VCLNDASRRRVRASRRPLYGNLNQGNPISSNYGLLLELNFIICQMFAFGSHRDSTRKLGSKNGIARHLS